MNLTKKQLNILQHAIGCDQYGQIRTQRNSYVSDPTPDLETLVAAGYLRDFGHRELFQGNCYSVTDAGKVAMQTQSPAPPKLTRGKKRYLRFLEYGDMFESFRHFLSWDCEKARSWNGGHD